MYNVSAIIPIYKLNNALAWERFTTLVDSVVNGFRKIETISKKNNEIILINDSPEIDIDAKIKSLFDGFSFNDYVILLNPKNLGQAYSRNLGAEKARGEYLHFIDQDDFIDSMFYKQLLSSNEDIIMGNIKLFSESLNKYKFYYKPFLQNRLLKAQYLQELKYLLLSNLSFSPGQYLIRRNVFLKSTGFPDLTHKGADDYGFFVKLIDSQKITFRYKREINFYYRLHDKQSKNSLNMQASLEEFFETYPIQKFWVHAFTALKRIGFLRWVRVFYNRFFFYYSTNDFD